MVELLEPDREVRRAVLDRVFEQQQAIPDDAMLDYLADRPVDSVRSLIALVQRVMSAAVAEDLPLSAGFAREVLEGQPVEQARGSSALRTSGLIVSSLGGIRSHEKMAWDWPDPTDRMIEDLR